MIMLKKMALDRNGGACLRAADIPDRLPTLVAQKRETQNATSLNASANANPETHFLREASARNARKTQRQKTRTQQKRKTQLETHQETQGSRFRASAFSSKHVVSHTGNATENATATIENATAKKRKMQKTHDKASMFNKPKVTPAGVT